MHIGLERVNIRTLFLKGFISIFTILLHEICFYLLKMYAYQTLAHIWKFGDISYSQK